MRGWVGRRQRIVVIYLASQAQSGAIWVVELVEFSREYGGKLSIMFVGRSVVERRIHLRSIRRKT